MLRSAWGSKRSHMSIGDGAPQVSRRISAQRLGAPAWLFPHPQFPSDLVPCGSCNPPPPLTKDRLKALTPRMQWRFKWLRGPCSWEASRSDSRNAQTMAKIYSCCRKLFGRKMHVRWSAHTSHFYNLCPGVPTNVVGKQICPAFLNLRQILT
jgi:hypothetical protein